MPSSQENNPAGGRTQNSDRELRYANNWIEGFAALYSPFLFDGMTVLDVGSGRTPVIPIDQRQSNCIYVGLDISEDELDQAPANSYDKQYASDLTEFLPEVAGTADLVLSWQVLEHVVSMSDSLENIRRYLRPGGHFVALLAGSNAHFAIVNRIIPEAIGKWAMLKLLRREPDSVFHANYDSCKYDDLTQLLSGWAHAEVIPCYRGAGYFNFFGPLKRAYLLYEDWIARSSKVDLATHYIIVASK